MIKNKGALYETKRVLKDAYGLCKVRALGNLLESSMQSMGVGIMAEQFTEKEQAVLSQFCTSLDSDCFALINLPEAVKGALFSRYSRSPKSLRRLLLDEFILNPESGFDAIVGEGAKRGESQLVATKKAEDFYDRVLVGYGDDSVAELGGAHLACENISNIVTKLMQDSRIGISPLEKSTRYVYFDQKEGGNYRYLREEKIMRSKFADEYIRVCDLLFDTYASLVPEITKIEQEQFPKEESASDRAYVSSIRAKVCDLLRGILPAATLTNSGFYGNGRAFEYMLLKMYASTLSEALSVAKKSHSELQKVIPSFVKRADDRYGREMQLYMAENRFKIASISSQYAELKAAKKGNANVSLVESDSHEIAENKIAVAILFPHLHSDLN